MSTFSYYDDILDTAKLSYQFLTDYFKKIFENTDHIKEKSIECFLASCVNINEEKKHAGGAKEFPVSINFDETEVVIDDTYNYKRRMIEAILYVYGDSGDYIIGGANDDSIRSGIVLITDGAGGVPRWESNSDTPNRTGAAPVGAVPIYVRGLMYSKEGTDGTTGQYPNIRFLADDAGFDGREVIIWVDSEDGSIRIRNASDNTHISCVGIIKAYPQFKIESFRTDRELIYQTIRADDFVLSLKKKTR